MQRIRTIKPEFFLDDALWDASVNAGLVGLVQLGFAALWTIADREGRFKWRPKRLKPLALPHWDGDFALVLDALESAGFVRRYSVDGCDYGLIPGFANHQRVHYREAPSEIPEPAKDSCRSYLPEGSGKDGGKEGNEWTGKEDENLGSHGRAMMAEPRGNVAPSMAEAPFRNLDDALQIEVRARCQLLIDRPQTQSFVEANRWPEVLRLATAFSTALRWHEPRFSKSSRAVDRMVELLATFSPDELTAAVKAAPDDEWLTDGRKGLGALTVDVVGQLLNKKRPKRLDGHRQPDLVGEETFSVVDLMAGGTGRVIKQ